MGAPAADPRRQTLRFVTMAALLGACFLLGGASRTDVLQLAVLHPLAVACIAVFMASTGPMRWDTVRVPLALLGGLAGIIAAQLVPLPPSVWTSLPGHARYAAPALAAGLAQPWRPISLSPDLTLSSLVSLVVPLAVLIGFASLSRERARGLLSCVLLGVLVSAVLGLAQLSGGEKSPLYLFSIANFGAPTGLFANRNHQSVMLAVALPMLPLWVMLGEKSATRQIRGWIALATGLLLLLLVLACGSRAGMAIAVVGLVVGWMIGRPLIRRAPPVVARYAVIGLGAVIALTVAASIVFSRDEALQRIVGLPWDGESRLRFLPTIITIVRDFFPVGAGFGAFDPVYRGYEPISSLSPLYLNHAHNDLAELVLTGGLPALLLLAILLLWWVRGGLKLLRLRVGGLTVDFGRLGLFMVGALLAASLVDYPLRTPLVSALFALACGWLADVLRDPRVTAPAAAKGLYRPGSSE